MQAQLPPFRENRITKCTRISTGFARADPPHGWVGELQNQAVLLARLFGLVGLQ